LDDKERPRIYIAYTQQLYLCFTQPTGMLQISHLSGHEASFTACVIVNSTFGFTSSP